MMEGGPAMTVDAAKVRSIFLAAVENHAPEHWEAYLDEACAGSENVRRRVEILLRAHLEADSLLDNRLAAPVATAAEPPAPEIPGAVIGPYKLLEQIGEGGMGTVYMAEQLHPVRRRVALKVIKPGMDTRQVIARFEAERQALALMDHPNIAHVLDAGATTSGRPYFVMELVHGIPITEFCDQAQLTPRERLELFVHVCQAVQHAHQKGIIHRDLKPSNVMVTLHDGTPVVKVIDFGIAKATGQQLTDKTLFTNFAQMIGTPLYMSPEQAAMSGLDVDTRSDIYSLGVLLYELLTGTTPFDKDRLKTAGYDEMRRIIRKEEPPRPSTRISTLGQAATTVSVQRKSDPKHLCQLLRAELDWIVMKALEKDRNRRYESAAAFAADVRRYLHNEPVQACPPSAGYRLRKFVRRYRGPVIGAVAAVALLLVAVLGLTVSTWLIWQEQDRTRAALRQSQTNYEQAEAMRGLDRQAVEDYLTAVSESMLLKSELPGLQPLRKELLEHALRYYQRFLEQKGDDPQFGAEAASAYFRVGSINEEIGSRVDALRAFEKARDLYEALTRQSPQAPTLAVALAKTHRQIGRLHWANGAIQPALQSVRQALALSEELTRTHPEEVEAWAEVARCYDGVATLQGDQSQTTAELETRQRVVALWRQIVREYPDAFALEDELAEALSKMCRVHYTLGHLDEAVEALQKAIAIEERLVREHPRETRFLSHLAYFYGGQGYLQRSRGQLTEMVDSFRRALLAKERLFRQNPAVTQYRVQLATTCNTLSGMLSDIGQLDEALRLSEESRRLMTPLAAENPGDGEMQTVLAMGYASLGNVLRRRAQPERALEAFQHAAAILEQLPPGEGMYYNLACMRALCSGVVGQGKTELTDAEQTQRRRYADQAMDALRKAVAAGFRNPGELKHDSELDALRSREDFQQLLSDLEAKKRSPR
jgi:serine/threonine protein kinase/tetratricopeptide (TPR) repeat protein